MPADPDRVGKKVWCAACGLEIYPDESIRIARTLAHPEFLQGTAAERLTVYQNTSYHDFPYPCYPYEELDEDDPCM